MLLGVNYSFKETTQYHFKGIALRVRFKKIAIWSKERDHIKVAYHLTEIMTQVNYILLKGHST